MKKHKKEHHEEHMDETWLVPYSDILTLLLALFIILFAAGQIDQKKYERIMAGFNSAFTGGTSVFESTSDLSIDITDDNMGKNDNPVTAETESILAAARAREEHDMREMKEKIDQYINENNLSTQLETRITDEMLMISIRDYALFDSGSALVKTEAQKLAHIISDILRQYPNYNVEVAGHTDNLPINTSQFPTNWDLSAQRSLNFMKYLLKSNGLDQSRFRTIGYGEFQPIASNTTEEGRARNRRVEVNILRNFGQPSSALSGTQ
ncbi:MAG TPA: flagellar motor protein MotB [Desulfitobacterium dehalogenans]|uniref:Flagellar motor protein MotB n=1 Tax=Desulfitobacterium dehalogenans TaxID=36854 RepID=A0A7C6Z3X1_9FIRM|nr:flagellar motor protein MotB [Desulfitobacterium dehalogenans]